MKVTKNIKIELAFLFLLVGHSVYAQTFELPDTNFRNKLQVAYPDLIENGLLLTDKASQFVGALDLSEASINDATGIRFFTSISMLNLNSNNLSSIDELSELKQLMYTHLNDNHIESLPDLNGFINMYDFQVQNNELKEIPNISSWVNLRFLYCNGNQLSQLPDLSQLSFLHTLVAGYNPLTTNIDLATVPQLTSLHLHKTGIKELIHINKLTELQFLFAWGNEIVDFSGLDSLTKLVQCVISDNKCRVMPYFYNKLSLYKLDITYNYFTYEDILELPYYRINSKDYTPQRELAVSDIEIHEFEKLVFQLNYDLTVDSLIYAWYKNGVLLDSNRSSQLIFHSIESSDEGTYRVNIYHPEHEEWMLETSIFKIDVFECLSIEQSFITPQAVSCTDLYSLDFDDLQISGGEKPFSYFLSADTYSTESSDAYFEKVPAGAYTLIMKDVNACTDTISFDLERIKSCDPVFSPNGDGIADTYFIQEHGVVQIYNSQRELVSEFQAPIVWDGTLPNGVLIDAGYYVLILNSSEVIHLTVVR